MPVKPLSFKGDKKTKKRKHHEAASDVFVGSAADTSQTSEDDSWTSPLDISELAGPLVFVLPTRPPTCLASDPHGNVFASPLENMIDGDPKTAEPHNVQQVWVATKVAGLATGEMSFKASHGGYLSCDSYGILGARREARGREETFVVSLNQDEGATPCWQLRTAASKGTNRAEDYRFLSATSESDAVVKDEQDDKTSVFTKPTKVSITIRGDGEESSETTHVLVRMQSRFRPQSQKSKEAIRVKEKVSRRELEAAAGRTLTDEEAKRLKRAKRDGTYHEEILDIRAKGKHDKFA